MTYLQTIATALIASAGLMIAANPAQADTYHHIDDLALQMQRQTRDLYHEFGLHYRHTPGYDHLRSDALQLYRLAEHIHTVAHYHGDLLHLQNDLQSADRLFHHLEALVDRIEHDTLHPYGGHTHGDLRHVRGLMRSLESVLHHLRSDVESLVPAPVYHHGSHGHHGQVGHGYHGYHGGSGFGGAYSRLRQIESGQPRVGIRVGGGRILLGGPGAGFRIGH